MIRRLLRFIFSLVSLALLVFVGTVVWVICDGLTDMGDQADVAIVPGHGEMQDGVPGPLLKARLDRVIQLYKQEDFRVIVVSGATGPKDEDETVGMAQYLVAHEIPAEVIVQANRSATPDEMAHELVAIMQEKNLSTVMIVTHYYQLTRLKLAFRRAGILLITNKHVGKLQQDDAPIIYHEVIALYGYLNTFYLLPLENKVVKETKMAVEKAGLGAQKVKEKISDKIDSLAK